LSRLAARIKAAGVTSITGSVIGSTGYFSHDWWAHGWKRDFPKKEVALPSALTIDGNTHKDKHIKDPERRAAVSLTKKLLASGVAVTGQPGAGSMPHGLQHVAAVQSQPLSVMMRYMDRQSSNFFAEMLGKRLAVAKSGRPGTIAHAAAAIHQWAGDQGVPTISYDSSGLSYDDRVTPRGIVNLLSVAENKPWINTLRSDLAGANQGTLEHRLSGVRVRAKTGTLEFVSALSGWVFSKRTNDWVSFSILSSGMYKTTAASIEDDIVRTLARAARPSS
jgi:D-alanyl-D-alanine carboxypeptidase/D-alanyl-D-alanine-endopeptidase (penicillin-binding protein 4)